MFNSVFILHCNMISFTFRMKEVITGIILEALGCGMDPLPTMDSYQISGPETKWDMLADFLLPSVLALDGGSVRKDSTSNAGDQGIIPGLGRSPGEGNDNPLQYSCLENSMDRGAWGLQSIGMWLTDWITTCYPLTTKGWDPCTSSPGLVLYGPSHLLALSYSRHMAFLLPPCLQHIPRLPPAWALCLLRTSETY